MKAIPSVISYIILNFYFKVRFAISEIIIPGIARSIDKAGRLNAEKLINATPPTEVAIIIEKLKVLDCTDVATSFACSTCLATAA